MNFGRLGASFGRLGAGRKPSSGGAPAFSPSLDFSDASNSQYQPLVISTDENPFLSVDRDLMGINWKVKGRLP